MHESILLTFLVDGPCSNRVALWLLVAAPNVEVGLPGVKLALIPLYGGTVLLPRLIGESRALKLMLGGDPIPSELALQWGLGQPAEYRLGRCAGDLVRVRACHEPSQCVATRTLKRLMRPAGSHGSLAEALAAEAAEGMPVYGSDDAREGIAAFLEERKPAFRDR